MAIGFVIVSHRDPHMLRRLVLRLNHAFGDPPIVCHHDSQQVALDEKSFPRNVQFVPKPIRTRWADISVVQACLIALRQLYEWKCPDWFIYLSGSDYPIKAGDSIRSELMNSPYDGYLDYRRIEYEKLPRENRDFACELGFRRPYFLKVAYNRYIAGRIRYPGFNRKGRWCIRNFYLRDPRLNRKNPFKNGFACFAGDAWMTARARCAELLLSQDPQIRELLEFYAGCLAPDESFFHTVLCNSSGLNLCDDNRRYEDWRSGKPSPKVLGLEDLQALLTSGQHFARKFSDDHDPRVLDALDRLT